MIDVITTTIHPEMLPICAHLVGNQTVPVTHTISHDKARPRASALGTLLTRCSAEFFAIVDDDDFIPPDFLARHIQNLRDYPDASVSRELVSRVYHASGRYSILREPRTFQTFSLYRIEIAPIMLDELIYRRKSGAQLTEAPLLSPSSCVIMRGFMDHPETGNMDRAGKPKNASPEFYPHKDPDGRVLEFWLESDSEAIDLYRRRQTMWA